MQATKRLSAEPAERVDSLGCRMPPSVTKSLRTAGSRAAQSSSQRARLRPVLFLARRARHPGHHPVLQGIPCPHTAHTGYIGRALSELRATVLGPNPDMVK